MSLECNHECICRTMEQVVSVASAHREEPLSSAALEAAARSVEWQSLEPLDQQVLLRSAALLVSRLLVEVIRHRLQTARMERSADVRSPTSSLRALCASGPGRCPADCALLRAADVIAGMYQRVRSSDERRDVRVLAVKNLIATDFSNPRLSVASTCGQLGLSPWHLRRLLRRHTGMTFNGILYRTRVAAAQDLLVHTFKSVKEVAASVGFANTAQLDRHFCRHAGLRPSEYRSMLRAFRP